MTLGCNLREPRQRGLHRLLVVAVHLATFTFDVERSEMDASIVGLEHLDPDQPAVQIKFQP